MQIVKNNYKFYLKIDNDLIYIDENIKYNNIKKILNSIIYFEQYKTNPLEGYIKRINYNKELDNELIQTLQLQLITDKYYFI